MGGTVTLKWMLRFYGGVVWTGFIWLREGTNWGWVLVKKIMNLRVP
jgi:hypothetical protein